MFSVRNRQSHRSSLSRLARCGAKEWPMGAPNHITFSFWEFQLSFHDETTDHTQDWNEEISSEATSGESELGDERSGCW